MKLQARWELLKLRMRGLWTMYLALVFITVCLYFIAGTTGGTGITVIKILTMVGFAGFMVVYYLAIKKFDKEHKEAILKITKGV